MSHNQVSAEEASISISISTEESSAPGRSDGLLDFGDADAESEQDLNKRSFCSRILQFLGGPPEDHDEDEMNSYREQVKQFHTLEREMREDNLRKSRKKAKREKMSDLIAKHDKDGRALIMAAALTQQSYLRTKSLNPTKATGENVMIVRKLSEFAINTSDESSSNLQSDRSLDSDIDAGRKSAVGRRAVVSFANAFKPVINFDDFWSLSSSSSEEEEDRPLVAVTHSGPSHFSVVTEEEKIFRKYQHKKRRISQLYIGNDVYHHDLTRFWDHHEKGASHRFYEIFEEEIRKKFPITPDIQKKIDKIINRRKERERKVEEAKAKAEQYKPTKIMKFFNGVVHAIRSTTLCHALKSTPRYYQMTPVVPKRCRRCKNKLEDTLEPRWTPIGVTFAILFPIAGILCCIANREFVCVVCEEIYLYGDYPTRCRPVNKDKPGGDDLRLKKRRSLFPIQPTK